MDGGRHLRRLLNEGRRDLFQAGHEKGLDLFAGPQLQRLLHHRPGEGVFDRPDDLLDDRQLHRRGGKFIQPHPEQQQAQRGLAGHLSAHPHPNAGGMTHVDDLLDQPKNGGMGRLVQVRDLLIDSIDRQRVLNQVVGSDGEEIHLLRHEVAGQRGRWHLDHGADFDGLGKRNAFSLQFLLDLVENFIGAPQLLQLKDLPAETLDHHPVILSANIELPDEVPSVIAHGAQGVGLFRTEFLYLNRNDFPTEAEQYEAYVTVAERVKPHPVIVRTMDLGGDKFFSPLELPSEMNPFMGWRAIRFSLARPDLFRVQLRAVLRASVHGNLKLMYPMISGIEELLRANEILHEVEQELSREGLPFNPEIEVGAMIEVPSAAMTCDLLAEEVDFFSIGTNDLIQYALAVDRVNEKIAYLYEPTHPAILRLVQRIIDVGHAANIWVGMCGEMAGEPALSLLLLGMGLDEFSASPVQVPIVKQVIRSVEYSFAKSVVEQSLKLRTGKEVEAFLSANLKQVVPALVE